MSIKRISDNFLLAGYVIANIYVGIIGIQPAVRNVSAKIKSESQLAELLQSEKENQHCNKDIVALFTQDTGGHSGKSRDGKYAVTLGIDSHDIGDLEHEVFHICSGQVDRGYKALRYYLLDEPLASIYSLKSLIGR